ncbi:DUF4215 domain-containing protein [Candidatus Peregrinibacteria bacterium]|nr:DUF4215 domain-containing protein [Candidatus Peregrinibacteria bacterium]
MSPGVWTVPSTCTPLPAQDPPVMQEEPLQTVGTSNIVYFNNGQLVDMPGLRCKVTAMRGFDRVYVGDSGWIECPTAPADPAVFNYSYEFTGLSLNQTYYYHTQSTSDPVDPPTGGFSGYSNEVSSRQISGGSSGGGLPPNFCGDGSVGGTEECDDGNNIDGDGCSSDCKIELYSAAMCGDGIIQAPEECDDGNNNDGDGCSAACEIEEIVNVRFVLKAVPEFRTAAATHPNLGLNAILGFYKPAIANLTSASVVLDNNGNGTFEASIVTGSYDIAINGEAHLNKILREIVIDETTREITLDFSIGDTWQLTAGDTKDDNSINALDMASMIAAYRSSGGINDLNKFGGVNSIDMAILLLNYKRAGDQWLL